MDPVAPRAVELLVPVVRRRSRSSRPRSRGCPRAPPGRLRRARGTKRGDPRASTPARRSCPGRGGRGCSRRCGAPCPSRSPAHRDPSSTPPRSRPGPLPRLHPGKRRARRRLSRTGCPRRAVRAARASGRTPDRRPTVGRAPSTSAAAPRTATRPAHARPTPQGSGLPSPGRRCVRLLGVPAQRGHPRLPLKRGDRRHVGGAGDGEAADDREDVRRRRDQGKGAPGPFPSSRGLPAGRRPPPSPSRGGRRRRSCSSTRRRTASRSSGRACPARAGRAAPRSRRTARRSRACRC